MLDKKVTTGGKKKFTLPSKVKAVNQKEIDAQNKKMGAMESAQFQKGFKQGLKAAKKVGASGNQKHGEGKRDAGINAGIITSKQDRAKFYNKKSK